MTDALKEHYSDVASNFMAMLSDFNYADEMELLNISKLNILQRKNLAYEFEALYIALWYSCLQTSFPKTYQEIFDCFVEHELPKKYKKHKYQAIQEQITQYIGLLGNSASKDLTPVSHHILSLLKFDENSQKTYELKITLHIRKVYTYIFERLI